MSATDPDTKESSPELQTATRGDSLPPKPPRQKRRRPRLVPILILLAGLLGWLAYEYAHQAPAEPTPADTLALDAAGGWWNVVGDRYLELDWEGRRASLWDYSVSENGEESTGTWRTTDRTVIVQVSGPGGNLTQEFELIGNDAEAFLAPAPASSAKLLESWIADHDEEGEDVSPRDSKSREAAWRGDDFSGKRLAGRNHSNRGRASHTYRWPTRSSHAALQTTGMVHLHYAP